MNQPTVLGTLFGDAQTRFRLLLIFGGLVAFNAMAWAWAFAEFRTQPILIGTAFLAYVFGLRHAFDADHIAAIDNVVRKLMQEKKKPLMVGFFFSLGHSSIVIIASAIIAASAAALQGPLERFHEVGGGMGLADNSAVRLLGQAEPQPRQDDRVFVCEQNASGALG